MPPFPVKAERLVVDQEKWVAFVGWQSVNIKWELKNDLFLETRMISKIDLVNPFSWLLITAHASIPLAKAQSSVFTD